MKAQLPTAHQGLMRTPREQQSLSAAGWMPRPAALGPTIAPKGMAGTAGVPDAGAANKEVTPFYPATPPKTAIRLKLHTRCGRGKGQQPPPNRTTSSDIQGHTIQLRPSPASISTPRTPPTPRTLALPNPARLRHRTTPAPPCTLTPC